MFKMLEGIGGAKNHNFSGIPYIKFEFSKIETVFELNFSVLLMIIWLNEITWLFSQFLHCIIQRPIFYSAIFTIIWAQRYMLRIRLNHIRKKAQARLFSHTAQQTSSFFRWSIFIIWFCEINLYFLRRHVLAAWQHVYCQF